MQEAISVGNLTVKTINGIDAVFVSRTSGARSNLQTQIDVQSQAVSRLSGTVRNLSTVVKNLASNASVTISLPDIGSINIGNISTAAINRIPFNEILSSSKGPGSCSFTDTSCIDIITRYASASCIPAAKVVAYDRLTCGGLAEFVDVRCSGNVMATNITCSNLRFESSDTFNQVLEVGSYVRTPHLIGRPLLINSETSIANGNATYIGNYSAPVLLEGTYIDIKGGVHCSSGIACTGVEVDKNVKCEKVYCDAVNTGSINCNGNGIFSPYAMVDTIRARYVVCDFLEQLNSSANASSGEWNGGGGWGGGGGGNLYSNEISASSVTLDSFVSTRDLLVLENASVNELYVSKKVLCSTIEAIGEGGTPVNVLSDLSVNGALNVSRIYAVSSIATGALNVGGRITSSTVESDDVTTNNVECKRAKTEKLCCSVIEGYEEGSEILLSNDLSVNGEISAFAISTEGVVSANSVSVSNDLSAAMLSVGWIDCTGASGIKSTRVEVDSLHAKYLFCESMQGNGSASDTGTYPYGDVTASNVRASDEISGRRIFATEEISASVVNARGGEVYATNAYFEDDLTANNGYFSDILINGFSDDRLKTRTCTLSEESIKGLYDLTCFKYVPNREVFERNGFKAPSEQNERYGLSAQEVMERFPETVFLSPSFNKEYYSIHYESLVPVIVQALKDLDGRLGLLEKHFML